ncbi:hypothetical protein BJX63DRAFT_434745 [Aspergillus granulosus]|uniref:FAD-dependent oxidoreductase 2 FAD-binding domain-containing protein n=1 Tax=Aspergillus granulosus TaxID=176169 RepID=A0ABR4H369_9EURO
MVICSKTTGFSRLLQTPCVSLVNIHHTLFEIITKEIFDVIIIGLGPAGLAASATLQDSGLRVAVVDSGKPARERDRYDATDATSGHGGAGLFSDGKFSFFPSATELWTLKDQVVLRKAYSWTCNLLQSHGLDTPPFPSRPDQYSAKNHNLREMKEFVLKSYPSDYLSLPARMDLIDDLISQVKAEVFNQCHVEDITYDFVSDAFTLSIIDNRQDPALISLSTRRVLYATGRFGPLGSGLMNLTSHHKFRRLEAGFRIEQQSDRAFFRNMKQLDPKLRFVSPDRSVEWSTFCVCRQGETVLTKTEGLWTVSGRSDCPPTGRSNTGFNTLIKDASLSSRNLVPLIKSMSDKASSFEISLQGALHRDPLCVKVLDDIYGPDLRLNMMAGLAKLAHTYPDLRSDKDAKLIGQTLEGVGWYHKVDGHLRLLDTPVFVAGDACGLFRGIVAALISGYYSAFLLERELMVSRALDGKMDSSVISLSRVPLSL